LGGLPEHGKSPFFLRAASLAQAPLPTKKTFAMHTLPVEWLTE
jgi:hypothetical protein